MPEATLENHYLMSGSSIRYNPTALIELSPSFAFIRRERLQHVSESNASDREKAANSSNERVFHALKDIVI